MIFDIMMPVKDGITALKELREAGDVTPVIMLTAKSEVDDRITGLDSGADDYLTKPFAIGELLARIRSLTRRNKDFTPTILSTGSTSLDTEEQELSAHNSIRLSGKETKLMKLFMLNENKELSTSYLFQKSGAAKRGSMRAWCGFTFPISGKSCPPSIRTSPFWRRGAVVPPCPEGGLV